MNRQGSTVLYVHYVAGTPTSLDELLCRFSSLIVSNSPSVKKLTPDPGCIDWLLCFVLGSQGRPLNLASSLAKGPRWRLRLGPLLFTAERTISRLGQCNDCECKVQESIGCLSHQSQWQHGDTGEEYIVRIVVYKMPWEAFCCRCQPRN